MNKVISFIAIFLSIIFFISCKASTGPISADKTALLTTDKGLRSTSPVIGSAYLWVNLNSGDNSIIKLRFGKEKNPPKDTDTGEQIKYDGTINNISPTAKENANSYAFQSGTVTGVVEILSETQVKVTFSRNISPYLKISDVVCTAQQ